MAAVLFGVVMGFVGMMTIFLIPIVFGSLSNSAQNICRQMVFGIALFMPIIFHKPYKYGFGYIVPQASQSSSERRICVFCPYDASVCGMESRMNENKRKVAQKRRFA